ncbi:MAG TPA: DUF3105 domain-containing protein [Thermoleophilaceae bacterium]|nr:DUF3105 domain-containing protein [Thermoleophilaceae bacterium]
MSRRAFAVGLTLVALGGCGNGGGGEDGNGGGAGGGAEVFPAGGSVPDDSGVPLEQAARAAGCVLKTTPSRGEADRQHTTSPDETVRYRGNPPTLGSHAAQAAGDGLYQQAPPDESLVHTMEHGRVIIWAKPSLPAKARKTLRALFEEDDHQLVVTPRATMPYEVAETAWNGDPQPGGTGRTLGCPKWNDEVVDALRAFRDEHRGRGPEPIP